MNKRGHLVLGAILGLLFIAITENLGVAWFGSDWQSILLIAGIIVLYSLLPDLDQKNSTITWSFLGVGVLGLVIAIAGMIFNFGKPMSLMISSAVLIIVIFVAAKFSRHRGFIHTIQVGIISVIPLWFLFGNLGYCLLAYIAWHSHLIGDGFAFKTR